MIAMRLDIFIGHMGKRKGYGPVVRQPDNCPGTVVEVHPDTGISCIAGLGKDICNCVVKVAVRVGSMTLMKSPVIVEAAALTGRFYPGR